MTETIKQEMTPLNTNKPEPSTSKTLRSRKVVDLVFQNITYEIKKRVILDNINGICPGGHVTAIMGSSGAGKTTLLNVLACRITNSKTNKLTGKLLANNCPYDYEKFSQFASYVMQNDVLMETMTPKEALEFAANLKYSDTQIKQSRVIETLKCMRLERCQNTFIGGISMKGISGGERKRTSIGYELVSNPSCILLDEPTSGLDSFTAFQIIHQLRKLADEQDRTIIFTIHQPSSDIFLLFDRIMLLVQGRLVYQGSRENIINHFSSFGFKCPDHSNPMDYFLSITHSEDKQNIENYSLYFENYQQKLQKQIESEILNCCNSDVPLKINETSFTYQIGEISSRGVKNIMRDHMQFRAKVIQAIFLGLLKGGVFWGAGRNNGKLEDLLSISGALFFICVDFTMNAIMSCILSFSVEREVFLREENSKLYTTKSYFLAKQLIEIPFCVISPLIQQIIAYWMIGLNDQSGEVVLIHLLISVLVFVCSNSMGLMAGAAFKDIQLALNIVPAIVTPLIIFSGFYSNQKTFYPWIGWLQYLSPMKYGFEAMSYNENEGKYYENDPEELYGFDIGLWWCALILFGYIVVYRFLAFLFLYGLKQKLQ
ncbi:unnamed protein product [Paramecium primaurelia]|uniref:ABC transporter domain-containing protein n=1 Tax=Paramecium primaurelia TaxID=5886 RepID=A0A8S1QIZ4_PARPR|nr:unnamed protein product [Paramecium primaurelia]